MIPQVTLLELVQAVSDVADTEAEVIATVVDMVNSGLVRLIGNFRDCRFNLDNVSVAA